MKDRVYRDYRNYDKEAQELIAPLRPLELYRLYEIVRAQLGQSQPDERRKELNAVQKAIEGVKGLDKYRLRSVKHGHRSEMASGARATDGNTRHDRKKV